MKKCVLTLFVLFYMVVTAQTIVKDIYPGAGGSYARIMTTLGNNAYFIALDDVHGGELWKTDGTTLGTAMVKDIRPGLTHGLIQDTPNVYYSKIVTAGNAVYFCGNDGVHGWELWKSDGTAAGTVMVKDIDPNGDGMLITELIAIGNTVYFAGGAGDYELWKSDGTANGTQIVKNINPIYSSYITGLTNFNGKLIFTADDNTNGTEFWISDGTTQGTALVKDIYTGVEGGVFSGWHVSGNTVFFAGINANDNLELWKTDGTAAGTVMVKDINPTGNSTPQNFATLNGSVIFQTYGAAGGGRQLWITDGTSAGTTILKNINPNASGDFYGFTQLGPKLYFSADDGTNGVELWVTDGTTQGTHLFLDINNGTNQNSNPYGFINANGKLYFGANDGTNGNEPWVTDGTVSGTKMLNQVCPGICYATPEGYFQLNNMLLFVATEPTAGFELYRIDLPAAPSGVTETPGNKLFILSPNPVNNMLQVNVSDMQNDMNYQVIDLQGKLILQGNLAAQSTGINVTAIMPGTYLLKLSDNTGMQATRKFLKE